MLAAGLSPSAAALAPRGVRLPAARIAPAAARVRAASFSRPQVRGSLAAPDTQAALAHAAR
jgi:hypothetical protein